MRIPQQESIRHNSSLLTISASSTKEAARGVNSPVPISNYWRQFGEPSLTRSSDQCLAWLKRCPRVGKGEGEESVKGWWRVEGEQVNKNMTGCFLALTGECFYLEMTIVVQAALNIDGWGQWPGWGYLNEAGSLLYALLVAVGSWIMVSNSPGRSSRGRTQPSHIQCGYRPLYTNIEKLVLCPC